jgi:archaellum biogenesis ATPase FlaH
MKNINNKGGVIIMDMVNKKDQIGYDINEKDIDGVIRFLKINDPKNATPERAIAFLASTKLNFRKNNEKDFGDNLIDLYNEFKKNL